MLDDLNLKRDMNAIVVKHKNTLSRWFHWEYLLVGSPYRWKLIKDGMRYDSEQEHAVKFILVLVGHSKQSYKVPRNDLPLFLTTTRKKNQKKLDYVTVVVDLA